MENNVTVMLALVIKSQYYFYHVLFPYLVETYIEFIGQIWLSLGLRLLQNEQIVVLRFGKCRCCTDCKAPTVHGRVVLLSWSSLDRSPLPDTVCSVEFSNWGTCEGFWSLLMVHFYCFYSLVVESSVVLRLSETRYDLYDGVSYVLFILPAAIKAICHSAWIFIIVF